MNVTAPSRTMSAAQKVEHFDVLIVGAGISGVGSAYHLTKQMPGTPFVALEEQETFGGTWWTHKYPGIRSDSDLHTFGYSFKPWKGPPIATADEIRDYMGEVIEENGLAKHIRYNHHITHASWSGDQSRTVDAVIKVTGSATLHRELPDVPGLYRHSEGLRRNGRTWPNGLGSSPQTWPKDLARRQEDRRDRSGATAATLIELKCAHVPCCSSPTYFRTAATRSKSPNSCAAADQGRVDSRSCAGRSCSSRTGSPAAPSANRKR
jgi:hypothetical protein